jgi:hypothetical protein
MTPRSRGSQPIEPWLPHGIHDRLDIHGFILYHYLTFTMKVATPSVFRTATTRLRLFQCGVYYEWQPPNAFRTCCNNGLGLPAEFQIPALPDQHSGACPAALEAAGPPRLESQLSPPTMTFTSTSSKVRFQGTAQNVQ